jgi:hypothetical protein
MMTTALPAATQTARAAEVKALLRDIGYVLWLSKRVEAEVVAAPPRPREDARAVRGYALPACPA